MLCLRDIHRWAARPWLARRPTRPRRARGLAPRPTRPMPLAGRPCPSRSTLLSYTFLPFGPASCYPIRLRYFDHPGAALPKRATFIRVELVVSEDHGGLEAAIARHFQGASWQRCQVPYARNLLGMVGYTKRKELAEGLRGVFAAPSREVTLRLASELGARLRWNHPGLLNISESTSRNALSAWGLPRLSPSAHPRHQRAREVRP